MTPRGITAAFVLALISAVIAIALASKVSASLAQGATAQQGDAQRWKRQEATPMGRYKAASRETAAELKVALADCNEMARPVRSACARVAREQQRTNLSLANARIKQDIAESRGPEQAGRQ